MKRLLVSIVPVLFVLACRGRSSTSSTTPTTPTTPPGGLTGVSLTGLVTAPTLPIPAVVPVQGAVIKILDGPNAGAIGTSDSAGKYIINNLTVGNANVSANADIYDELKAGVTINGTNTLNFNFPTPTCLTNVTGRISFRNASPRVNEEFRWDGVLLATLTPGQTSETFVTAAGPHTLQVTVAGTTTPACNPSTPSIVQCSKDNLFTCAGP